MKSFLNFENQNLPIIETINDLTLRITVVSAWSGIEQYAENSDGAWGDVREPPFKLVKVSIIKVCDFVVDFYFQCFNEDVYTLLFLNAFNLNGCGANWKSLE